MAESIENDGGQAWRGNRLDAGKVYVASRAELVQCSHWARAFADQRKDRRHFELVEDTIHQGFEYRYFIVTDNGGEVCAVQPFFVVDQDLLAGTGAKIRAVGDFLRRLSPRFLIMRTLMLGCSVGEGHLDGAEANHPHTALLAPAIVRHARELNARLVVLKEFPARYRSSLECFLDHGYARAPSFPMTRLNIEYDSFEHYMTAALSRRTRRDLRLKFKAAAQRQTIEHSVVGDITPVIDEVYPLYLHVYQRSKHRFERLSKEYLCGLGRLMPDKTRFFVWRQGGRIVAFTVCMMQGDSFYAEYIGLDYSVALDLHLYHYAVRDMVTWAMGNGYKWFRSSGLNYDPKFHLRCVLDPLDLYVRHTSRVVNAAIKWLLPWLAPVRYDDTLKRFPNYPELWADKASGRAARTATQEPAGNSVSALVDEAGND
ncbi:MAG: GNAT family N-acetyltransferase [Xanthobacteraceae bacterium]